MPLCHTKAFFDVVDLTDLVRHLRARVHPNADNDGKLPLDYTEDKDQLKGTDAYWKRNEACFQ